MKNYAYKLVGEGGVRFLSTLFLLILARMVGAAEFGVYSTAFAFATVFGIMIDLGTNPLVTREIARYPDKRPLIIASVNTLKIIASVVMLVCLWIVSQLAGMSKEEVSLVHWFGWVVIGIGFTEYLSAVFTGLEQMGLEAVLKILGKGVVIGAALITLFRTHQVLPTVQVMGVFSIISIVVGILLVRYRLGSFGFHADRKYLQNLLARSMPLFGSWAFLILYASQGILILNLFKISDHDIGVYALATKIIDVLKVLPVLLASTFFPSLSRQAHLSKTAFQQRARELLHYAGIGFPTLTLFVYVAAPLLLRTLYGSAYQEAVPALRLLLLGFLPMTFNLVLLHILISLDKEKEALFGTSLLSISNLTLSSILIPRYGMVGVCYALIGSELIYLSIQSALIHRTYRAWHTEPPSEIPSSNRTAMCSIIIPTFNTCQLTLACLDRIQKFPPPGPYEVILIDNNSNDGTYDQVRQRFPDVIAIRNPGNLGFARACNRATQEARGEFFLFLNSDTEPTENSFAALLNWMKTHPQTAIAGPQLIGPGDDLLQLSWGWHPLLGREFIHRYFAPQNIGPGKFKQWLLHYMQRAPRHVPFICGACLLIRRDVFRELSGFDEKFELYFEDSDLCWRCTEAGWQIDFVPDSKIIHHIGQSSKGTWNMASLIYQQSHITFYRKHAPSWSIIFLKGYLFLKWLRIWLTARFESKDRMRARIYSRSFLQVILESMRFTLDSKLAPWVFKGSSEKFLITWNRWVQILSRVARTRRGLFKNLLLSHFEVHEALFGHYRFYMDFSLGWLQRIYFLKPDVYEWETQAALRRWVQPGMTVLDIGAHTGYMTLLLADLVGPEGQVYAFEPASRIFALLKTNIEVNHLSHVSIFQMALSDCASTVPLYLNPINDGNNSLGNMKDNSDFFGVNLEDHQEQVTTDTIDHFLSLHEIPRVDMIKIDVEGAEALVFSGARELLKRPDAPPIICEVGDINQPYFGQREQDLRRVLYDLGYRSFWIETFKEFGPETPVHGLRNVLFSKTATPRQGVRLQAGVRR